MDNYRTYSDEQLSALLKSADQRAFEEIYHRYWKRLFTLAYHKLQSRADVEDIVHDIFTSIWIRREELNIQSLEAYLATAVKYKILEFLNKTINRTTPITDESSIDAHSPADQLEVQIMNRLLQDKIRLLPEKCRIVFEQSRLEGKSNPEIARDLNISRKTVEKHISSALRQLRLSLREIFSSFFSL